MHENTREIRDVVHKIILFILNRKRKRAKKIAIGKKQNKIKKMPTKCQKRFQ